MPLSLDDPRWRELETAYGDTAELVEWLAGAYSGDITLERIGDIINEVMHQGDTSDAMYAVASHFLALGELTPPEIARDLVIFAGLIHGASQRPGSVSCPDFLWEEFVDSAKLGADRVRAAMAAPADFDDFKYQVAALAGFLGYGRFGGLIEGFDLFEGKFHHVLLDEPFDY